MDQQSVEEVRARMARIRARAHRKASRLGEETRQFLDWKHYLRLFPWGSVAVAAAVGYFAVPRRPRVIEPNAKALAELARSPEFKVTATAGPKRGLMGSAFGFVGNLILKAALAYAGQQVSRLLLPQVDTATANSPEENSSYEYARPLA